MNATQTKVQMLRAALQGDEFKDTKQLSQELHLSEKELPQWLEKLTRTLAREGAQLLFQAPHCIACGFEFTSRQRFARPSRCPACRSERIVPVRMRIAA
jgi:predicted Zn-ribbon and HTH transcriptional regulator